MTAPVDQQRAAEAEAAIVAGEMMESLARAFPVCTSSDEFYWFPQAQAEKKDWSQWDELTGGSVDAFGPRLHEWERRLEAARETAGDFDTAVDAALLASMARSLREQLCEIRFWEARPTVPLTVACVGLAEALDEGGREAWTGRITTLPGFLDRSAASLAGVPRLFQELGLEMASSTRAFLAGLGTEGRVGIEPALAALARFEERLAAISLAPDMALRDGTAERTVLSLVGCCGDLPQLAEQIELELAETDAAMAACAAELEPAREWRAVIDGLPPPAMPGGGLIELYREQVERLAAHCLAVGIVSKELHRSCPVSVGPVPAFLRPVRAGSSYSIPPGHPPTGGRFNVVDLSERGETTEDLRECAMLAAHETYPGHHVLDSSRWSLAREVRRPIESPLFYEGWACFAETLVERTGLDAGPVHRLLLARRRRRRALRGKVDLALLRGTIDVEAGAELLAQAGFSVGRARTLVRRYALNPGYQLCYSIGLRRFLGLFDRFGTDDPGAFARGVLAQGEIGLDDLERALERRD